MRNFKIEGRPGEAVMIYSGDGQIILQVRRLVHGVDDPLAASFKSGVRLDAVTAARVAVELLQAAARLAGESKPST